MRISDWSSDVCFRSAALQTADAAIPTLPVPDTLVEQAHDETGDVVDRSVLARVQTPQAFRLGILRRAHAEAVEAAATDDAQDRKSVGSGTRVRVRVDAGGGRVITRTKPGQRNA